MRAARQREKARFYVRSPARLPPVRETMPASGSSRPALSPRGRAWVLPALSIDLGVSRVASGPRWLAESGKLVSWPAAKGRGGLPGGTRTPDLLLRRQLLYPVELRAVRLTKQRPNMWALCGMVGAAGFELATLCSQSRCATRLRYAPTAHILTPKWPVSGHGLQKSPLVMRKTHRQRADGELP